MEEESNISKFPSKHIDSIEEKAVEAEEYLIGWLEHYNIEKEIPLDILLSILNRTVIYYSIAIEEG